MPRPKAPKPETEIILEGLQEQYFLKNRDEKIYQQMFEIIIPYARSLVLKTTKNRIFLSPDIVDDAALDAAIKFMSQYKEKPDFKIAYSFGGILRYKVLEALYGDDKIQDDLTLSLNGIISPRDGNNSTELEEMSEQLRFTHLGRPLSSRISLYEDPAETILSQDIFAIDSCVSVARDLFKSTTDLHSVVLTVMGMILFIKKAKCYNEYREKFLFPQETQVLDMALLEMRMRLAGEA